MKKHTVAFFILVLVGSALVVGAYYVIPILQERDELQTSDAGSLKGRIRIGVDNWIGYVPLCAKETKKRLRGKGYALQCIDDQANYPQRMKALDKGELDFAVGTVDSFILNGKAHDYPGSIVLVIDQSKGGDAIVGQGSFATNLEGLKDKSGYKIALTPDSPSEHLLKSVAFHFDIPIFSDASIERIETNGSTEALKKLRSGEAELAVLWEPDVSRALKQDGVVKVLGTEKTSKLIVDVLIASRRVLKNDPQLVMVLLDAYLSALKVYRDKPALLEEEIREDLDLSADEFNAMIDGVAWSSLTENALDWYGISSGSELGFEGLVDSIESTIETLQASGDFSDHPLPGADPYRLVTRNFVEELFGRLSKGQFGVWKPERGEKREFSELSPEQWSRLRRIGSLKILPITFQSGTSRLTDEGKEQLDVIAEKIEHYPAFRIELRGHTSTRGDKDANLTLSEERADAVRRYFSITHGFGDNRMRALGVGSSEPLARKSGESLRAYQYRLPRVEVRLLSEEF